MKKRTSKSDVLRLIQSRHKFLIIELSEAANRKLLEKQLIQEAADSIAVIFIKK